jgi:hypothetical protein
VLPFSVSVICGPAIKWVQLLNFTFQEEKKKQLRHVHGVVRFSVFIMSLNDVSCFSDVNLASPKGQQFCLIFGRCSIKITAKTLTVLTAGFHVFFSVYPGNFSDCNSN